jgi:hypothetical protein
MGLSNPTTYLLTKGATMHAMQYTTPTGKFHVSSYGNGWAYEIVCQTTGDSLWFQDDDASFVQAATNDFENESEIALYFENF